MRGSIVVLAAIVGLFSITVARPESSAAAPGHLVDVHGTPLYVEIAGSGPPLLFLHGGIVFFDNSFAEQRDYFSGSRTVIGFDRRGHGHSPDNGKPFSYAEMVEETAALIEQLGIAPVDVVGHSDGGDIALLLARDHPRLVRRVVVSGANLRAGAPAEELERRSHWTDQQVLEKVHQVAEHLPPRFRTDYERVAPDGRAHWQAFLVKSYRLWLTPVVIEAASLKSIAAPVLVMAGDHDFTPAEETLEIFRNLPHGQLMIVPGTGHGTFTDRADLVDPAIRDFLDK